MEGGRWVPGFAFRLGVYHRFESNRPDIHYGTESDLMLLGKWRGYSARVAYGDYSRDQHASSTRRRWIELDYVLNDQ